MKMCPKCGAMVEEGMFTCTSCGATLAGGARNVKAQPVNGKKASNVNQTPNVKNQTTAVMLSALLGDAFHHYRLIAFGLLGGAALGAGLGALTANLKIGLRMLILLGMALMVFLLPAVLGGWEGAIVVTSAFPALMALYAAFDGRECEMEPVDEPVRPVQPVRMTATPDEKALRALERLPKLRELGALSDEEYEQKKAELLKRL